MIEDKYNVMSAFNNTAVMWFLEHTGPRGVTRGLYTDAWSALVDLADAVLPGCRTLLPGEKIAKVIWYFAARPAENYLLQMQQVNTRPDVDDTIERMLPYMPGALACPCGEWGDFTGCDLGGWPKPVAATYTIHGPCGRVAEIATGIVVKVVPSCRWCGDPISRILAGWEHITDSDRTRVYCRTGDTSRRAEPADQA